MRFKNVKASILLLSILLSAFLVPAALADKNGSDGNFQAEFGVLNHRLYVSIPPSLYNQYANLGNQVNGDGDYAKLVTPQTVAPIAEILKNLTNALPNSDEQFADAVLTFVHQIPYNITGPKYPVQTLVDDSGDCTALSLLAASIMKAGGLDVVLVHYTNIEPSHMNVGVYLPYTPAYHSLLLSPTSFEYDNKTYWTAEATPKLDWRVGDQSDTVSGAQAMIIPLDTVNNSSWGVVSASLGNPLLPSSITINLSQQPSSSQNSTRALVLSGSILPQQPNQTITAYISRNGTSPVSLTNITDSLGEYTLFWNFTSQGTYNITVSWSGTAEYAGADSEALAVFIGPPSLLQFQTPDYNYIYGQLGIANYLLHSFLGVNNFMSVPLGTNVSLSYDFTILPTGHEASLIETETVTVPASEHTMPLGPRHTMRLQIPEKTIQVPKSVPNGWQPLRLPDDFNETINNQFCLILQNNPDNNYSLNLKGLNGYDVASMQENQDNTLVNATASINENTWYRITSTISASGVTTTLQDMNGTVLESGATPERTGNNTMVLLLTDNIDSAVAFKDLKVQLINTTTQPPQTTSAPEPTNNSHAAPPEPYSVILVLVALTAAVVLATVIAMRFETKKSSKTDSEP